MLTPSAQEAVAASERVADGGHGAFDRCHERIGVGASDQAIDRSAQESVCVAAVEARACRGRLLSDGRCDAELTKSLHAASARRIFTNI